MYRALLFQLFTKAPDLQEVLNDFLPSFEDQSQHQAWTIESLRELLSLAIAKLGQRQVKCFIDALDECEEQQVQEMVIFFEELGQDAIEHRSKLFVCFASRHYPTIDTRNGKQLTLEHEHGHSEDLAKYVQNHLRAGKGSYVEDVRTQIQEKANGVFIWAVLVVDILNEEFRRGRIFAVKKRLQEIPPKLGDLFKDILRRDCANMTDLLLCLQWILFARRPLRREEFYFAMVAGLDPEPRNINEWDPEFVTEDDMNRFVLNSSKGLAELTKSRMPTVQFIHESVRDYLIKDNGLHELWPELTGDLHSWSHDQLKKCCQTYLQVDISDHVPPETEIPKPSSDSAKDLRQRLDLKFPFLDYASRNILYHSDEAAGDTVQEEFLASFHLPTLISITNLFERYDIRRHSRNVHLLYVLAENNLVRLITTIRHHYGTVHIPGGRYRYPLFAACANGHRDAVRALLQRGECCISEDLLADLDMGRAFSPRKDLTPLLWALELKNEALAEIIAASEYHGPGFTIAEGSRALVMAASRNYGRVVNLLVEAHGVDVNLATESSGDRPLEGAACNGNTAIIQLLFNHGANIETSSTGGSPVVLAARTGHNSTVQLLLSLGANIEARDEDGESALIAASNSGWGATVQLLLEEGADIEAKDHGGRTSLIHAADCDQVETMRLLLNAGANIEARDQLGMTALILAAVRGNLTALDLLLLYEANFDAMDNLGNPAIVRAALCGTSPKQQGRSERSTSIAVNDGKARSSLSFMSENEDSQTVEHLLARNSNSITEDSAGQVAVLSPEQENSMHSGPLRFGSGGALADYQMQLMRLEQLKIERLRVAPKFTVSRQTAASIVRLLLANGANPNAPGIDGMTALIIAAKLNVIEIVWELLDANANVEAMDNNGMKALHWSTKQRSKRITALLLANGANKYIQDRYGKVPVAYAEENDDEEMIDLLLAPMAEISTMVDLTRDPE